MVKLVINEQTRRRWLRIFKHRQRSALDLGQQADQQIERLLIRRFDRLVSVRRFVFLWLTLFGLLFFCGVLQLRALSPFYQTLKPVPGGMYAEGLIGSFTNADPIYATSTADAAISRLIFSGLFKYDKANNLVGDLARAWTVDPTGKIYTVSLTAGITWQDGQPFTADDVVFTYRMIQNPAAQSSLYSSWQGITVAKVNTYTVSFSLPNALSSFPYGLTNGIIPAHLLKNTTAEQLRSSSFNTEPVGTGPFKWKFVEVTGQSIADREQRITLAPFDNYQFGRPKLDGFSLLTFSDDAHMLNAFKDKQINAMSGLESLPDELAKDSNLQVHTTPLTSSVMAFFNNSQPILSDANVRKALVSSINRREVISLLRYPVNAVNGPLLTGQLGYDPALGQLPYNLDSANQLLDGAGWTRTASGQRAKGGQSLQITLSSQDTQEYTQVAQFLQKQWDALGVKVVVRYYSGDDLQSSTIANHSYDILLYGISIGVDPDVFAYWDSSQASVTSQGHLNLSEYKSGAVDQALEAGRTRSDPALRALKYKAFLSSWAQDAPALALYQPNFVYITRGPVFGYDRRADNSSNDRFYNVNNWMIRQQRQDI